MTVQPPQPDHTWIHDHLATALTNGLTPDEQSRFDTHIHACPDCFDAFTEARDADRTLLRTLDSLIPAPNFEDRLITNFQEKEMKTHWHPLAKRAGFAIAAAVALACTGVGAQYIVHGSLLNNPLSQQLAAQSDDLGIVNPVRHVLDSLSFGPRSVSMAAATSPPPAPTEEDALGIRYRYGLRSSDRNSAVGGGGGGGFQGGNDSKAGVLSLNGLNTYRGETVVSKEPAVKALMDVSDNVKDKIGDFENVRRLAELPSRAIAGKERQQLGNKPSTDNYFARNRVAGESEIAAGSTLHYFAPGQQLADAREQRQDQGQIVPGYTLGATGQFNAVAAPAASVFPAEAEKKISQQLATDVPNSGPANAPTPSTPALEPAATQPTQSQASPEIAERKIIRNGNVEFEVRSFDDAFATVSSVTREEGGFISATSSDKLANGKVRGSITLRVPPDHLDRLLLKLRALGDLKSQQIGDTDITKEYTDLDSELRALRAMESRLIDLIKDAKGQVKDLVAAEKQLGEYRVRIEKIEGEMRYDNNLVGMATLTITAYEKDIQTPTAAQEQENVTMNVETEDVETKYTDARKIIDDAKGRIIDSELQKHDAGQFAANITAEVPPDKADFVAAQLKQLGTVATFNRDRKQTTTGGNGAPNDKVEVEQKPTRFTIALYNLANIAPRETALLSIAVPNVEAAFKDVITDVRRVPDDGKLQDFQPKPIGRIVTSSINGQQPDQMSADIRADISADQADTVLSAIRNLGEVMSSSLSENPDTANVTAAKRGLQLRIVNVASVPARESRTLTTVAQSVPESYNKLITALQSLETNGSARILASQLNQSDPRTINAQLAFDVRRDSLPAIDKAFTDAGIDTLSRNITRSNDTANTLDSKIHFQIDQLQSADALPPKRTTTLGIEADNIEPAIETLRTQLQKDGINHIQYNISKESSGRITAHLIADIPLASTMTVLNHIHDIGGTEKVNQVIEDPQVPDTRFAKERIDLTLSSRDSLVASDHGLLATTRAALASAAAALLWSLYLILTGLLFAGPWLALAWLLYRITKRRKVAA